MVEFIGFEVFYLAALLVWDASVVPVVFFVTLGFDSLGLDEHEGVSGTDRNGMDSPFFGTMRNMPRNLGRWGIDAQSAPHDDAASQQTDCEARSARYVQHV